MKNRIAPEKAAFEIFTGHFSESRVLYLCGSVTSGLATKTSDLDLVIFFDHLDCASRQSFVYKDWPVEAFLHDLKSFRYFCSMDKSGGRPFLANMIANGIAIPEENDFSKAIVDEAKAFLNTGPDSLSQKDIDRRRYSITNLVEDIQYFRNRHELYGTASRLLEELSDFYFRANGFWSASDKSIFRVLEKTDKEISDRFKHAFDDLFKNGGTDMTADLVKDILEPFGGFLFDGYNEVAPRTKP